MMMRSETGQIALLHVEEEPRAEPETVLTLQQLTVERIVSESALRPETVIQHTVQVNNRYIKS